jgi:Bacterial antitoxin of type II TA system, VapB
MRTTLELSEAVVEQARNLSGIVRISDLVREGLQALIAREARKRLIAYGGSDPEATSPGRQRYSNMVAENAHPR